MGYLSYMVGFAAVGGIINLGINIIQSHLSKSEDNNRMCGICRRNCTRDTAEIRCKKNHPFHQSCVDSLKKEGQMNCIICGEDLVTPQNF